MEAQYERRGNGPYAVGADGLCRACRFRRGTLALALVLKAASLLLTFGLPCAFFWGQVTGRFTLDATWTTLYVTGVTAFTAVTFGLIGKLPGITNTPKDTGTPPPYDGDERRRAHRGHGCEGCPQDRRGTNQHNSS